MTSQAKRILVTGGCGFLGSNLAAHGLSSGHAICVFDNLSRTGSERNLEHLKTLGNLEFVNGDIRREEDVARTIREFEPEILFHLSGQVAMTTSLAEPRRDFEINTLGTINVLEAVRRYRNDCTVLYSSTNKVYGDLEHLKYSETPTRYVAEDFPDGFDERLPLDFHSPYGCSKGAADLYMLDYHRMFHLKTAVFRHSSMYGARQYPTFDQGWIGWFCQQALTQAKTGLPIAIAGTGKQVRDVLHAEDMVSLYFEAADKIDAIQGQAFNIGGGVGNSLSIIELFQMIDDIADTEIAYQLHPGRKSDQRVFIADIQKISNAIGWQPRICAREGIEVMIEWIRTLS